MRTCWTFSILPPILCCGKISAPPPNLSCPLPFTAKHRSSSSTHVLLPLLISNSNRFQAWFERTVLLRATANLTAPLLNTVNPPAPGSTPPPSQQSCPLSHSLPLKSLASKCAFCCLSNITTLCPANSHQPRHWDQRTAIQVIQGPTVMEPRQNQWHTPVSMHAKRVINPDFFILLLGGMCF